jgi:hypothetical protein
MILILITLSGVSVWAAPEGQEEDQISGVVTAIVIEVGEDGTSTVLVTLEDGQEVRLSLETAIGLGLVQVDENGDPVLDEDGNPIPNEDMIGETVQIEPGDVIKPPISGEVQEIVIEVDEEGTVTVLVTLVDELGETQTVRLSLETAIALGLVEEDAEGNPIVNEDTIGETVEIDPSDVIEEDEEEGEEGVHPVASALAEYFADTLGLDYDTVMGYHEEGMGFGVIAQACWISFALESDATLLGDILAAKKSGDFSAITLTDGTTPKNWGQFKKAALGNEKAKKNLGAIMSGRAKQEQEQEQEMSATGLSGKGKDKGGKPDTPPGQLKNKKDKDKGGGPPAEPPGQGKNKDKGGGKKK